MNAQHLIYTFIVGVILIAIVACGQFQSDPCKGVNCGPDRTCFEGECICFYGEDINGNCIPSELKGSYWVVEDCSSSISSQYSTYIDFNGERQLIIIKFWELFVAPVVATYESPVKLRIARQEPDNDNYFVEGEAALNIDDSGKITITFKYTVKDETDPLNIQTDSCNNTVYTKQ